MKTLTIAGLKDTFAQLGYKWSTAKPNLIGVRTTLNVPDVFNDLFLCAFTQPEMQQGLALREQQAFLNQFCYVGKNGLRLKEDNEPGSNTSYALDCYQDTVGTERMLTWTCTTLPGVFYLTNPVPGGCGVLVPGQYVDTYLLGLHLEGKPGQQKALVQRGAQVRAYRDDDRDVYAEETAKISEGFFGMNIHHASGTITSVKIWNWSAGCQVFANAQNHAQLLGICEHYKESAKNLFTYTLLRERELI